MKIRIAGTEFSLKYKSLEIYIQGCYRGCPGCHNPDSQPFCGGKEVELLPFLYEQADKVVQFYDLIDTVYVTGGDLLCQSDNIGEDFTNALVCTMPLINYFWLFTGCEEKYLPSWIWKYYDIVKCGNYQEDNLNPEGSFPASKNQKLLFNKRRRPLLQYKFDTTEFMGEKKWK